MAAADNFPLTPYFPIPRKMVDRKLRQRMESGKLYVRSKGSDLMQLELTGLGTEADVTTLQNFYEQQALQIFTFQDLSFTPQVNRIVAFGAPLEFEEVMNAYFQWKCTLVETTLA